MTTATAAATIDEARLEAFVGQAVLGIGAAISRLLHIGHRLGRYKAMAGTGPITSSVLALRRIPHRRGRRLGGARLL